MGLRGLHPHASNKQAEQVMIYLRPWLLISVICLRMLCKPLLAEETADFWQAFRIGGYSSADLRIPRDETAALTLNEVSLIVTWNRGSRLTFFSELELENPLAYTEKRGLNGKRGYLDLERFYFDYNLNEKANLRLGRFLTPAGRWNQLHAPPLVWTASRPLATTRLFPNGVNGAMVFGSVPMGQVDVDYQVYVEGLKDQHRDDTEIIYREVRGARLAFNHLLDSDSRDAGLNTLGLNVMSYQKDRPGSPTYHLLGLDFLLELNHWEFSGELYARRSTHGRENSHGGYLQSAYALGNEWYWITRLETLHETDTRDADRWVIGATKRVKPNQLLKFEFVGGNDAMHDVPRGFITSFAVMF